MSNWPNCSLLTCENPANYRPVKKKISIYVEADVLEHFKSKGKGYQTTINRVLRQSMLSEAEPHYGTHKPGTADDKP